VLIVVCDLGLRNLLLWLLAVCLTVYVIDTVLFRKENAISKSG